MTNSATRLITLIMLLQRQPNRKAGELAEELGVSIRTVHRYFGMLEELGIPLYSERGPAGGFSLVRGYKMPPLVLNPEEAVAVGLGTSLVEEMWGHLYRDAARGALAKLDNLLPNEQRQEIAWARRALIATQLHRAGHPEEEGMLDQLRSALHDTRRVRITYDNPRDAESTIRDFDPYALVHRWGRWYTAGYCHLRGALRLLRLDRIRELRILEDTFTLPVDFNAHAFLEAELQPEPVIQARVRFAPEAAGFVHDSSIGWSVIEPQADGSLLATLPASDLVFAASMLISFGPAVTILAPEELKKLVADWAHALLELYPGQAKSIQGEMK